jgi:uncharacterized Zn-binding protein involved in type VI secretion
MPFAAHLGDITTNAHGCNTSVPIDLGAANVALAKNVTVNGVPVAVVGSQLQAHTILSGSSCVPHVGQTVTSGSSTVRVGGLPVAYQGSTVSCPGTITGAAGTVTVGV